MKKLITMCFSIIIVLIIFFSIIEFKNNTFSLKFYKQLSSIMLCISVLLFWNNFSFIGIVLYNLCFIIIFILKYVAGDFLKDIFIIVVYGVFDFYQISHYIKCKSK